MKLKFFIAGIMQGSKTEEALHCQSYRDELKIALHKEFPDSDIFDPRTGNEQSLFYELSIGKSVFMKHNRMCGTEIDVLVAYIPEASMGTAIEIWEAWKNGAVILIITPLVSNWVVKFLNDAVYPDVSTFLKALEAGEIKKLIIKSNPRDAKRNLEDFIVTVPDDGNN